LLRVKTGPSQRFGRSESEREPRIERLEGSAKDCDTSSPVFGTIGAQKDSTRKAERSEKSGPEIGGGNAYVLS